MFNPFRPKTVRRPLSPALPTEDQVLPEEPDLDVFLSAPLPLPPVAPVPPPRFPPLLPASAPAGPAALAVVANAALEQLVAELPGLLFTGLTAVETGEAVPGLTLSTQLPPAVAHYHADMIRLERLALHAAQGTAAEVLREMLITMSDQLHLLCLVRQGDLLLSLVLDANLASLSVARVALLAAAETIDESSNS